MEIINLDTISVIAAIISAIGTVAAVVAAILIPWRIAKHQNDIALFEKRLECYESLKSITELGVSFIIDNKPTTNPIIVGTFFYNWVYPQLGNKYRDYFFENKYFDHPREFVTKQLKKIYTDINSCKFLFSNINIDEPKELLELIGTLFMFLEHPIFTKVGKNSDLEIYLKEDMPTICSLSEKIYDNILPLMESELNLTNKKKGRN